MDKGNNSSHVALVTGAAKGIGHSICAAIAGAGIDIVAVDIADLDATRSAVEAAGASFTGFSLDVGDLDGLRDALEALPESARPDIIIANAGIYPAAPFEEVDIEDWRHIMRINVEGVFCTLQAGLPFLRSKGWGRVVVLSSSTVWMGVPQMTPYVASKAALLGIVRSLAHELGEDGITVNALTPGLIETESVLNGYPGQQFDWVVGAQAVKRRLQPEDLTSTVLWLVDEASSAVTGQAINVDGGAAKH